MRTIVAGLIVSLFAVTSATAQVKLVINNQSGQPDSNVWIQWAGQTGTITPTFTGTNTALYGTTTINGTTTVIQPTNYTIPGSMSSTGTAVVTNGYLPGYQLSTMTGTGTAGSHMYQISNFAMNGGRMYISLGSSGWTSTSSTGTLLVGYTPPVNNFNDPNFMLRNDKVEAFIMGSSDDNIDMTAVDDFSIAFQVQAYYSGNASVVQTLTSSNAGDIFNALSTVSANPGGATPNGISYSGTITPVPHITTDSPYLNINSNSLGFSTPAPFTYSPVNSSGSYIRVIGNDQDMSQNVWFQDSPKVDPVALANGNAIPLNYLWKPFTNYISYLDGSATTHYTGTTTIGGTFVGTSAPTDDTTYAQTYNLAATLSPTGTMVIGGTTYTGVLTISGTTIMTAGPDSGKTMSLTLQIPYSAMLNPTGIVGANAEYVYMMGPVGTGPFNPVVITSPGNDVMTWVEGDFLAGMNIGTVGSNTTYTGTITYLGTTHTYNNATVGSMPSQDWFQLGQALENVTPSTNKKVWDYYFSYLQPSNDFYNDYAAVIYPYTDAYNFAYGDRVTGGNVAISWNATQPSAIDTVVITILPDSPGTTDATPFNGSPLGSSWFYQPSFGYYNETYYPWVFHNTLGFMYFDVPAGGSGDTYMYASDTLLGWLYTNPSTLPNVYSFQEGTWLYFYPFSTFNNFYNYTTGKFETHVVGGQP